MTRAARARHPVGQRAVEAGVTLSESDGVRYLHFGSVWVQGAMRVARPFSLELEYQRQMMALGLLLPAPRRVLQLGLGAAALAKFCWRHLQQARITVVELLDSVVTTARRWFRLPEDDERLQVVVGDARRYVTRSRERFDWLQVDLYDAAARGPVYGDTEFYRACRARLASPGVAAFNLFGRHLDATLAPLYDAFGDRVLVLPEADGGNRVALAYHGPVLQVSARQMGTRTAAIERDWRLPARQWWAGLQRENGLTAALEL